MAKKLMYVCLAILVLSVAYHFGVTDAKSTLLPEFVGVSNGSGTDHDIYVLASNGDLYLYNIDTADWYYLGNPVGGATATQPTTWGQIKAEFGE